jgi:general secretion pathway protein N
MKTNRYSTWGMALGLLLAVVLHAPAQWLASGVNAASRGHVQLRDAQGTVWQGHAQWVLTSGPGGQDALALPQRLHWQWRPQWNGLELTLNAACCTPQPLMLKLQPVWLGLQVSLVSPRSVWPAQWLSGLGAPWNTLALNGVWQCPIATSRLVVGLVHGQALGQLQPAFARRGAAQLGVGHHRRPVVDARSRRFWRTRFEV